MSERPVVNLLHSPRLGRRPHVETHLINWDLVDSPLLVMARMGVESKALKKRCRFLNPLYTVTCDEPSLAFYRKALWARQRWIKIFRDTVGPRGFDDFVTGLGATEKQFIVSGVTYLDGELVRPDVLERNLQLAENPELALITTSRRRVNLDDLRTPEGRQTLISLCRAELQATLSSNPLSACYFDPASTLSAPSLTTTFLAEARKAENHWHGRLRSHMGNEARTLPRSSDLATKMLLFHGLLTVNHRAYLPGHWPDKWPSGAGLGSHCLLNNSISLADLGVSLIDDV